MMHSLHSFRVSPRSGGPLAVSMAPCGLSLANRLCDHSRQQGESLVSPMNPLARLLGSCHVLPFRPADRCREQHAGPGSQSAGSVPMSSSIPASADVEHCNPELAHHCAWPRQVLDGGGRWQRLGSDRQGVRRCALSAVAWVGGGSAPPLAAVPVGSAAAGRPSGP
ncbi:MAG: hypothetical protein RLZZ611_673 [Cyanobacteriota bacterium]